MKILTSYGTTPDLRALDAAAEAIRNGLIVLIPTGTQYALVCDALNNRAVERLCRIKGLNAEKNLLSVIVSGLSRAGELAKVDNVAFRTLKRCLPGPYTFVLPAAAHMPKAMKGRRNIGVRIPGHPFGPALSEATDTPLLASSVSGAEAEELVDAEFLAMHYQAMTDVVLVIDGGAASIEPTTVVDLTDSTSPQVLRQGAGDFEE